MQIKGRVEVLQALQFAFVSSDKASHLETDTLI